MQDPDRRRRRASHAVAALLLSLAAAAACVRTASAQSAPSQSASSPSASSPSAPSQSASPQSASQMERPRGSPGGRALSQYAVQSWNDTDGLPQNSVQAIAQTRDGYVWFGTQDGIARFDGVRFTVFGRDASPALNRPYVWALEPAADGGLWIGLEEGGVVYGKDGRFRTYSTKEGLPSQFVRRLLETSSGKVFVGTFGGGAARLENGKFVAVPIAGVNVADIAEDAQGAVWIATFGALNRVAGDSVTQISGAAALAAAGLSGPVKSLSAARDSGMWVGTGNGLYLLRNGRAVRHITQADGLPSNDVTSLATDSNGTVWIGTAEGVARLAGDDVSALTTHADLNDYIWDVAIDHEGSVWAGTSVSGAGRLRETPFIPFGLPEGLASDWVSAVRQARNGDMWLGTADAGVSVIGLDGVRVYDVESGALQGNSVFALEEAPDGTMWIGTMPGITAIRGRSITSYGPEDGVQTDLVRAIEVDHDGNVWLGTRSGLINFRPGNPQVYTTANGLNDDFVMTMLVSRDSALWVATRTGVTRFRNGMFRRYSVRHGLPDGAIAAILEDADGTFWFGTEAGLTRFTGDRFVTADSDDGLCDDLINSVVDDMRGNLWIGTPRGIYRIAKKDFDEFSRNGTRLTCVLYGAAEGMRSRETNGATTPSAWRAADGRLWFATLKGAVVVDPANPGLAAPRPPILVESVATTDSTWTTLPAELPPGTRRIELRYTAPSFIASEKMRFRYRLDGIDDEWRDAGAARVATYTNLGPGHYMFRVMAVSASGELNPESASYAFTVLPLFHETIWFRGLLVLAATALLAAAYRKRVGVLETRQRELEALVIERSRAEAQYRELFENATDAVFTTDTSGRFTALNRKAEQLTGLTQGEALQRSLRELLPPSAAGDLVFSEWMAGRARPSVPVEIIGKNGTRIPVEVNTRLMQQDGQVTGMQAIARDVRDRSDLERQLRQSQKMEAVGQLAGGVAHDFNNLLTVIRGSGEMLMGDAASSQQPDVQEIIDAADRASALTRQLLAFSRKQIVQTKVVDVNSLIRSLEKMLRRLIGEDIEVRVALAPVPCRVLADPGQIEQVLMNLAVNARDAMPGGGSITIATTVISIENEPQAPVRAESGRCVVLTVTDTGVGMDPVTQARIFEPFFTTKAPGSGTGLGLSTVYGIVQQAGGQIVCRSEPGSGTEFRIYLPLTDEAPRETDGAAVAPVTRRGDETVLLVEDDDAVRALTRRLLQRQGYEVLATSGGEEAVAAANDYTGRIHLLVTDMVMPGMTGVAVAEALRASRPDVRVLLMSGYTDDEILRRGIHDPDIVFLQKPFTAEDLGRAVRDTLDRTDTAPR